MESKDFFFLFELCGAMRLGVIDMNGLTTHLYDLLTVLGRVHGRFCEEDLAVA